MCYFWTCQVKCSTVNFKLCCIKIIPEIRLFDDDDDDERPAIL